MTNSLPLERRMRALAQTMHTFFRVLGENHSEITGVFRQLQQLRRDNIDGLCRKAVDELAKETERGRLGEGQKIELLRGMITASQQQLGQAGKMVEQGIWKQLLEKAVWQAMERDLPEIARLDEELMSTTAHCEGLTTERDALAARLREEENKCRELQERLREMGAKLDEVVEKNKALEDCRAAEADYREIISKIHKELETKKEMDIWRLKVLYNRVASLICSDWSYPGVPKPDSFVPNSKKVQGFLESLRG